MTVAERISERLERAPFEELLRERSVAEAKTILGCSGAEVYRRVSRGTLACLKVEGAKRRGRGHAGRVSFLLEHLIGWQVAHEVPAGTAMKPRGNPRKKQEATPCV